MRARFLGSSFRNKVHSEPLAMSTYDISDQLVESGLFGRDPDNHIFVRSEDLSYSQSSLTHQEHAKIMRPRTKSSARSVLPGRSKHPSFKSPVITPNLVDLVRENTPKRPFTSETLVLKSGERKEAPNVYFRKVIPYTEPPAEANFAQLSEVVDNMLQCGNMSENDVYHDVFDEVVKQYSVECTSLGELLDECKNFFWKVNQEIPRIKKYYGDIVAEIYLKIQALKELKLDLHKETNDYIVQQTNLSKLIDELKMDLESSVKVNDDLMKHLAIANQEIAASRVELNRLDCIINEKCGLLASVNEEIGTLDNLISCYSSDITKCTDDYAEIMKIIEATKGKIEDYKVKINTIKGTIAEVNKEINIYTNMHEETYKGPSYSAIDVQCDLISGKSFNINKKSVRMLNDGGVPSKSEIEESLSRNKKSKEDIFKGFVDSFNEICQKHEKGKIIITTYEDMCFLKSMFMEYEEKFQLLEKEIEVPKRDKFPNEEGNKSHLSIYTSTITLNDTHTTVESVQKKTVGTQNMFKNVVHKVPRKQVSLSEITSPLLKFLKSNHSMRAPMSLEWLLEQVETLYDAKAIENEKYLSLRQVPPPFGQFIYNLIKSKLDDDFLVDQYCWDLYLSAHEHCKSALVAEMFSKFIDENYDEEQLALYLKARSDCMKTGFIVTIQTRDLPESYNEFYLSQDQTEILLKSWWIERYKKHYFTDILHFAISRPAAHLDVSKRYIAMHDILYKVVEEYGNDLQLRIGEMLMKYRIVPRIRGKDFCRFIRRMLPISSDEQIEKLYRNTTLKSAERTDVNEDEFATMFREQCLIYRWVREDIGGNTGNRSDNQIVHRTVRNLYERLKPRIMEISEYFNTQKNLQPDNVPLKIYCNRMSIFTSMLNHSLASRDGELSCVYLFRLTSTLDILFSTIKQIAPNLIQPSLVSMECGIKENWMDTTILT